MVTAFKYLLGGKLKKADEAPTREEQLLVDIRALKKEMEAAYLRFEYDDSVEAAIYELESLKRRYHRLLKLAKQEGLESSDIAVCYKLE